MNQQFDNRFDVRDVLRRAYGSRPSVSTDHWSGYAAALILVTLGLLIRIALGDLLSGFPFITFFFAVFLASYLYNWRAGALAAVVGGMLAWFLYINPGQSLVFTSSSAVVGLILYGLTTSLIIFANASMHEAFAQLEASERERASLNAVLEERVLVRTAELERANAELILEAARREDAEAQVRQMQKIEAVGQLTGGIAHDFNNLLAVILGGLNLTRRRLADGDTDVLKYVDAAVDGATRAATLTGRLMAFSRQQPLDPKVISANRLVSGIAEMLQRTIGETVQLETVLAAGLWLTKADTAQIESAILNLAVNARDAMPDGGKLTIETANCDLDDRYARQHGVPAGQYILLAVTDTGTGMPSDVIAKAFDPFFTTKGVGKGTGLGLSQVHGFVKQSGGHIKIYSEPGHGTTVKVYLPRFYATGGEPAEDAQFAAAVAPQGEPPERTTILLVEDDDAVRQTSAAMLRELGYTVVDANGARTALRLLDDHPEISLLFTDVVMPDMNGRKLADEAARRRPDLIVLFTTGFTRNAIVHHGVLDAGVNFISKPFTLDQLAAKVRQVLARSA